MAVGTQGILGRDDVAFDCGWLVLSATHSALCNLQTAGFL